MAFVHRAVDPEALRLACFTADATEITVYDADFPDNVGQQWVTAVVRTARDTEETFDLTSMDWRDLNFLIKEEAGIAGETVKFVLDLGEPEGVIALALDIENHYDGDIVHTSKYVSVPPPPLHPEDEEDEVDEWEQTWIYPHTGTGRTSGNSAYFVTVVGSDNPELIPLGTEYEFGL